MMAIYLPLYVLALNISAQMAATPDADSPVFITYEITQISYSQAAVGARSLSFASYEITQISYSQAVLSRVAMGDAQDEARRETRNGTLLPLRDIERKILPAMGGAQYLGPEYDPSAMVYRLKFIRDGRVIFVDVDARSGDILRHSR